MTHRHTTILYIIPAIILAVGLSSAILIYLTAENDSDSYLVYEASGGYVHRVASEDSKTYGHDSIPFGGKTNVPPNEFMHWVAWLWHGKTLSFTVASLTIYLSLGFFLVANLLLSDLKFEVPRTKQ